MVSAERCFYFSYHQLSVYISLYTQSSFWLYIQDKSYVWFFQKLEYLMKNLSQSPIFRDYMVMFCSVIFSILLFSLNFYSIYLFSGIFQSMVNKFSIYSFVLQYESFWVMGFINGLDRNLSILRLVVSDFAKYCANIEFNWLLNR